MINKFFHNQSESGFTLLEVLVSMMLFLVCSSLMVSGFITHLKHNTNSEITGGALSAAQSVLDELRLEHPGDLPGSGSETISNVQVGRFSYEVVATYCLNSTLCDASATRHIKVEVFYKGDSKYEVETVFTALK